MASDDRNVAGHRQFGGRLRIAVLIPCLNEETTIEIVVNRVRGALPDAAIFVYNNGSTDATSERATRAGAHVYQEPRRGKGNVTRRMFGDVDADVFVLVDGDDTYDVSAIPEMIDLLIKGNLDLVTGRRIPVAAEAFRAGHDFGNRAFTWAVRWIFGSGCEDVFSGLRVMTKRFVKSFPSLAKGFEIETELTVHALSLGAPVADYPVRYSDRPEGSVSKLRTYRDGINILLRLVTLLRTGRPFVFFSVIGALACVTAGLLGSVVVAGYLATGLVHRIPSAVLATGLMLSGLISIVCGVVLQDIARFRREAIRLSYLSLPSLHAIGVSQANGLHRRDESPCWAPKEP